MIMPFFVSLLRFDMTVGKLKTLPVREAFKHEAHNFTQWLELNIDALCERLGFQLRVIQREKSVGSFNVDLFCEDETGNYVIVENQLERSDHDHLGKLLTYLVNLDARAAIWITPDVRSEHQRVIDWLNKSTSADFSFYLVKVEAIRIGDSPVAPLFTILAAPDEQTREIAEEKSDLAERHYRCRDFWAGLINRAKLKEPLLASRKPTTDSWFRMPSGKGGISFDFNIYKSSASIDIYIDVDDQNKNKLIFDQLYSQKDMIEHEFGRAVDWERLDHRRASRISCVYNNVGNLLDQSSWSQLQELLLDSMVKFRQVMLPRINSLSYK
jgi:hypothetical protein